MSDGLSLSIRNNIKEVPDASLALNEFLNTMALTSRSRYAVNLVLEELLINIIRHAYKDKKGHTIDAQIEMGTDKVAITLIDDGVPFNPLSIPRPNRSQSPMERIEKGLGINLVRSMRKAMEYRRENDKNILKVWIDIDPNPEK